MTERTAERTPEAARRRRPWGPTAPAGPWDILVIGAGVGGLSAAALLGQLGLRVLVLEQHAIPGGFSQSFRRGNWAWDVGLHVLGELGRGNLAGRVFDALTAERLQWNRIAGPYDVVELPDGEEIDIPASLVQQREGYVRAFPKERAGLERYFEQLRFAAAGMRDYFVARSLTPWNRTRPGSAARDLALRPTAAVIAEASTDPRLRALLGVHWGYYGTPPADSPFGVHAMLAVHYRHGAFYPRGGGSSIGRHLSQTIADHRGWVQVRADVEAILTRAGRACGVRLTSGEELTARTVISAAGAVNTVRLLPETERQEPWARSIETAPSSLAHVCLHLGFKGDIRAAGASESNRWLLGSLEEKPWEPSGPPDSVYVSFPSLKDGDDHGAGADAFHTAEVVALTRFASFASHDGTRWRNRGADYEALKGRLADQLLDRMLRKFPRLKPLVAHRELSTPLSTQHFARGIEGAAYGLKTTPERYLQSSLKPRTPLKGLHLAGSDVAVVGIVGALVGGVAAAISVEPERAGQWLKHAVRRRGPPPEIAAE